MHRLETIVPTHGRLQGLDPRSTSTPSCTAAQRFKVLVRLRTHHCRTYVDRPIVDACDFRTRSQRTIAQCVFGQRSTKPIHTIPLLQTLAAPGRTVPPTPMRPSTGTSWTNRILDRFYATPTVVFRLCVVTRSPLSRSALESTIATHRCQILAVREFCGSDGTHGTRCPTIVATHWCMGRVWYTRMAPTGTHLCWDRHSIARHGFVQSTDTILFDRR